MTHKNLILSLRRFANDLGSSLVYDAADAIEVLCNDLQESRADGVREAAYIRTGRKDKDGREICVGDRIRILLSGPQTRPEYWNPEYEVIFQAPCFTLWHVGGGYHSDTSIFLFRTASSKVETLHIAAIPKKQKP